MTGHNMRYLAILLLLAGCASAGARIQPEPTDLTAESVVRELIVFSTNDFHQHGPAGTARFRKVRGGYLPIEGGNRQYMLCGEFQRAGNNVNSEWVEFVTIKTDPYEQWIGGQSHPFCHAPSARWLKGDLSAALQTRLASLR